MNTALIALFENSGFVKDQSVDFDQVKKATYQQLMDFCEEFSELSSHENIQPTKSAFSHSASIALGGGRIPCRSIDCRLERTSELVQFASFYSDQVFVNNFLYDHVTHSDNPDEQSDFIQNEIRNDIAILSYIFPLIKSGNIVPVTFSGICSHCLTVKSVNDATDKKFKSVYKKLGSRYLREVKYSIERHRDEIGVLAEGPEILLPHGKQVIVYKSNHEKFREIEDVVERLKDGNTIQLTESQAKKLSVNIDFVERLIKSVSFELGGSQFLKTSYLSDSDLEIQFIQDFVDDPLARRRDTLMQRYLTCLVPFVENIPPADLLKLREEEQEYFIVFRQALTKAINEYKVNGKSFSERDAQALYSDVIEPHLAKLDIKVKSAKRHFVKDSRRKIVGWAGAISAGIFAGVSTSNILAGSVAFGAAKAGAELLDTIMSNSDAEESARQDDMYFLWRAKKLAKDSKGIG